MSNIHTINFTL